MAKRHDGQIITNEVASKKLNVQLPIIDGTCLTKTLLTTNFSNSFNPNLVTDTLDNLAVMFENVIPKIIYPAKLVFDYKLRVTNAGGDILYGQAADEPISIVSNNTRLPNVKKFRIFTTEDSGGTITRAGIIFDALNSPNQYYKYFSIMLESPHVIYCNELVTSSTNPITCLDLESLEEYKALVYYSFKPKVNQMIRCIISFC